MWHHNVMCTRILPSGGVRLSLPLGHHKSKSKDFHQRKGCLRGKHFQLVADSACVSHPGHMCPLQLTSQESPTSYRGHLHIPWTYIYKSYIYTYIYLYIYNPKWTYNPKWGNQGSGWAVHAHSASGAPGHKPCQPAWL